jgi:hypothetical protein
VACDGSSWTAWNRLYRQDAAGNRAIGRVLPPSTRGTFNANAVLVETFQPAHDTHRRPRGRRNVSFEGFTVPHATSTIRTPTPIGHCHAQRYRTSEGETFRRPRGLRWVIVDGLETSLQTRCCGERRDRAVLPPSARGTSNANAVLVETFQPAHDTHRRSRGRRNVSFEGFTVPHATPTIRTPTPIGHCHAQRYRTSGGETFRRPRGLRRIIVDGLEASLQTQCCGTPKVTIAGRTSIP